MPAAAPGLKGARPVRAGAAADSRGERERRGLVLDGCSGSRQGVESIAVA